MNKQAFLEETYNSAFNDELEKIAKESIFDKDVRKDLVSTTRKGQWYPAIGSLSGLGLGTYLGHKLTKGKSLPVKLTGALLSQIGGSVAGLGAGAKLQTAKRDAYVRSMPNNKFKRLYSANRFGAGDEEMKEFGSAFNENMRSGKPLSKKHKEMQKIIMGIK